MPTLTIEQALAHALDKHRGGQVAEAELIYRKILAQQPTHADALHLLGMLKYQNGDLAVAIELIQKAIAASPNQAVFHSNLGLVLVAARQLDAAIVAYHRSLALAPRSAQAMNNLGPRCMRPVRPMRRFPGFDNRWKSLRITAMPGTIWPISFGSKATARGKLNSRKKRCDFAGNRSR